MEITVFKRMRAFAVNTFHYSDIMKKLHAMLMMDNRKVTFNILIVLSFSYTINVIRTVVALKLCKKIATVQFRQKNSAHGNVK